jgi:hypothetical protein
LREKTKVVEINGTRYQLRRLAADIGSFILMRLISAAVERAAQAPESIVEPDKDMSASTGEEKARTVAAGAMLGSADFEFHRFVQQRCLAACARLETPPQGGAEIPMPLMTAAGAWAVPEIEQDISVVMRLTIEVLVFNFSDFFDQEGMKAFGAPSASSL